MNRKLPDEAFDHYVALGSDRSYQAVAEHYGVTKVAVVRKAKREKWQARLRDLEVKARQENERKAVEAMQAVQERQLKAARYLQSRALEVLKELPGEKGLRAASALSIGWKHELLLLGEPTEREASVEEITRREIQTLLVRDDGE